MKVVKSSTSVLEQQPGIIGMFKHIEACGRIAYKSESRITDDSYLKFIEMLYNRGHWAVFNLGTVYLKFPKSESATYKKLKQTYPFTRWTEKDNEVYLTTNYRVICQLNLKEFMETYWSEPDDNLHYHRFTGHFICNRSTSHQLVRHRSLCPIQESQRYCNYTKGKFGKELTFILPQWVYRIRELVGNLINKKTGLKNKHILTYDGEILWNELIKWDKTVYDRNEFWKYCEKEYYSEIIREKGEILSPEEARGVLCNDVKTELCICGYADDWYYEPNPEETKEKAGFFYLRCASDAQADIRVLAESLKSQFNEKGYNTLK